MAEVDRIDTCHCSPLNTADLYSLTHAVVGIRGRANDRVNKGRLGCKVGYIVAGSAAG